MASIFPWWARRGLRQHVVRVRTDWVRAAQVINYGPVAAVCYGSRPRTSYRRGVAGALGLTDEQVVFTGQRSTWYNTGIPYTDLRWLGLRPITTPTSRTRALIIHAWRGDDWRVYTFTLDAPLELAQFLSRETGLPLRELNAREDFGPATATRLFQDMHGQWQPEYDADLYLAPDRLLFDWRDPVVLASMLRLDVYPRGELLRIEYEAESGDPAVVGFAVRGAEDWAAAIARRTAAPLAIHSGRKRKDDTN
ncbi:MAG: hypothetical protein GYB65_17930 [Chloroflexi bacterium]|nr:hypothetical protein [Chloroflexota bacterium]